MPVTNIDSRFKSNFTAIGTSSSVGKLSLKGKQEYLSKSLEGFMAFKRDGKILPLRTGQGYKVGQKLGEIGIYVAPKSIGVEPGAKIIPYDQDFFDYAKLAILELKQNKAPHNSDINLRLERQLRDFYRADHPIDNEASKALSNACMQDTMIAEYITRRVIVFKEAKNAKAILLNLLNEAKEKNSKVAQGSFDQLMTELKLESLDDLYTHVSELIQGESDKNAIEDKVIKLIINQPEIVTHITNYLIKYNAPTIQLIKQDYDEPIIPNRVTIPFERALNSNAIQRLPTFIQKPAAFGYQWYIRLREPKEENLNAIREVIATEIASNFMQTHKQQLIQGFYGNGTPKIATLATWVKEFRPVVDPNQGIVLAGGDYARGNYLAIKTERGLQSINTIKKLGSSYAPAIILGDRDFWGSTLGNKGRIFSAKGEEIFGIDFGHCFPSREKAIYPSLQDDFSFSQPREKNRTFKNYDIFTDTTLSEKMKGYHIAMKIFLGIEPPSWVVASYGVEFKVEIDKIIPGCAAAIFDQYIDYFSNLAAKDKNYEGYTDSLIRDKNNMLSAAKHMRTVFQKLENLTVSELDLRECLEKLTSKTAIYSPDGKVRLNHLRVERQNRVKWHIKTPPSAWQNSYYLETDNLNEEKLSSILANLQAFYDQYNPGKKSHKEFIRREGNKVVIEFKRESFSFIHKLFSEPAIMAYKKTMQPDLQNDKEMISSRFARIIAPFLSGNNVSKKRIVQSQNAVSLNNNLALNSSKIKIANTAKSK